MWSWLSRYRAAVFAGLAIGLLVDLWLSTMAPMLPDPIARDLVPSSVCPAGSELSGHFSERKTEDGWAIGGGWRCLRLRSNDPERDVLRPANIEEFLPVEGWPGAWLFLIYLVPLVGGVAGFLAFLSWGFTTLERRQYRQRQDERD